MATTTRPAKDTVAAPIYQSLPQVNESFEKWLDRLAKKGDVEIDDNRGPSNN